MMDLLGIKELRRAVDNDPKSPHSANFDNDKADRYPGLPDPLVLKNGQRVTTAKVWWTKRRPEIVEDFDREIYGRTPTHLPKVTWELVSTTQEMNGTYAVITKRLLGHADNSADPAIKVDIDLTLSTPANATGPVPVIMEFGLSREFMAMLAKRFPQFAQRGPGAHLAAAGSGQRMGLRGVDTRQLSAGQRRGADFGDYWAGEQRAAAQAGRLGRAEGLGVGREPRVGLL